FKVNENETIADCLSRMKMQGYMPVKRYITNVNDKYS
ncbi:NETI motif-containing protein, partial [Staphylococcus aureus]|nr:NETI motif-containing protein [Staphylococcus aureus]